MRHTAVRHPGARLAVLAGVAAAAALVASPAAQAAPTQAAVAATLTCYAEPITPGSGTIDCYPAISGAAPYSVSWSATGYGRVLYSDNTEFMVSCAYGSTVSVTAVITDSTGATTTAQATRFCHTGPAR
jgi:hypothetical protein